MQKLTFYEEKLAEVVTAWGEDAVLIFRGQANCKWPLNSSADRRLQEQGTAPSPIEYLAKSLIEPARLEGYAHRQDKELNDLELLAALQHQGAATCLIDFTFNFHIALWFACQDDTEVGRVFVVNRGDIHAFEEVTPVRATDSIERLFQRQFLPDRPILPDDQAKVYYWKPPPIENRILVQHSCFIFSAQPIKEKTYKTLDIPKEDKKEIRMLLQKFYGVERQTMFRDFAGFAFSHGHDQPLSYKTSDLWFQDGNSHFQRGEYELAIANYEKAIELNSNFAEAYNNRGLANLWLQRYVDAIADCDKAIEIRPQYADAYHTRGNAKAGRNEHTEAIEDYGVALSFNSKHAKAFNSRGVSKACLELYSEAIKDFDAAIEIDPMYTGSYYNRGIALIRPDQDATAAIEDFGKVLDNRPNDAAAYYGRGLAWKSLGQLEEARKNLERAQTLAQEQEFTELLQLIRRELDDLNQDDAIP